MTSRRHEIVTTLPLNAVLIGGGQPDASSEWPSTDPLLDMSLEMAKPEVPKVLMVTSARWASQEKMETVVAGYASYYAKRGLSTTMLHPYLYGKRQDFEDRSLEKTPMDSIRIPGRAELIEKTEAADVIFVLGGDSNRLLNQVWRPLGIDTLLRSAAKRGAIISGTSAGCLAWFKGGHTAGSSLEKEPVPANYRGFHYVAALGWIANTVCCPHYDQSTKDGRPRQSSFEAMLADRHDRGEVELGLGIDNNVALQVINGTAAQVLRGNGEGRKTMQTIQYRRGHKQIQTLTPQDGTFPLAQLAAS